MTMRQQWSIVAGIVVVLAMGLWAAVHFMGDQLFPVTAGTRAPDFTAQVLGSTETKSLADYEGQVVLLNIWATWCAPCRVEMPSIEKLHQAYGPAGLKVVAVSIDDAVPDDSIAAFAREYGLTFEVLHDPTHAIERAYQVTGYPETFVIGRDGIIRKKWISAADWNSRGNRALVAQLLGLAPPPIAGSDTAVGLSPISGARGAVVP